MLRFLMLLLILALGILLFQLRQTYTSLEFLTNENTRLRQLNSSLQAKLGNIAHQDSTDKLNIRKIEAPDVNLGNSNSEANTDISEKRTQYAKLLSSASAWSVSRRIDEISKLVNLTSEQKEKIKEKFEQDVKNEQESYFDEIEEDPDQRSELEANWLGDILGPELAQEYKSRRNELLKREQDQELEIEIFKLSKELNLTPDQQNYLKTALQETNQALKPLRLEYRTKMKAVFKSLHSPEPNLDNTEVSYSEIARLNSELRNKENELINSKIRASLSDEQFNALLTYQARAE